MKGSIIMKKSNLSKVLKDIVAGIMLFVCLASIASLDSESWIPVVTLIISFAYCYGVAASRGWLYNSKH